MGGGSAFFVLVVVGAILAALDLRGEGERTLVVYSTPALAEVIARVSDRFSGAHGVDVNVAFIAAGAQLERLRLSRGAPEADVILHASPFFIEKANASGLVEGGWRRLAWTPLVEIHRPGVEPPDLARDRFTLGLPDPRLSSNGVYNVILLDALGPEARVAALERTKAHPITARATVNGVAQGDYDVALGYEAAAKLFQSQGARVAYGYLPYDGERVTTPVVVAGALVEGRRSALAGAFLDALASPEGIADFERAHFRRPGAQLEDADVRIVTFDWSQWAALEARLGAYEVRS